MFALLKQVSLPEGFEFEFEALDLVLDVGEAFAQLALHVGDVYAWRICHCAGGGDGGLG